jgi:signal transduction histidine kinase
MAKNIEIKINYGVQDFSLSITDDGQGFDTNNLTGVKNGMGLASMKSRAAMIGGAFNIDSEVDKGTTISFKLDRESENS